MLRFARRHEDWVRVALVVPFVLLCYGFGWNAWRDGICAAFVWMSTAAHLPVARAGSDAFYCNGHFYRFAIACTALDAFFGSVPLVWMTCLSAKRNALFLAKYFFVLTGLNLARLAAGLWVFVRGIPWWLSHDAAAGVFYFALFLWIAHKRGWMRMPEWQREWSEIESAIAG